MRLFVNNLQRQKTILILNDSNTLLLSIYVVWWFFETKAFFAIPKKAKISKLQRLQIGLGMSKGWPYFYYDMK